jgi:hypothetical protein
LSAFGTILEAKGLLTRIDNVARAIPVRSRSSPENRDLA